MLGYMRPAGFSEAGKRMEAVGRAYEARHPQRQPERRRAALPAGVPLVRVNYRKPEPPRPVEVRKARYEPVVGCPAIEAIFADAEKLFGVSRKHIEAYIRTHPVVRARHYIIQRLYDELAWSYTKIGRALGRDHASVGSALSAANRRRVCEWLEKHG